MPLLRQKPNTLEEIGTEDVPELSESLKNVYTGTPTIGETFAAAFSQENSLGSLIANQTTMADKPMPVDGYDPLEKDKNDIKGYEIFAKEFMFSQSPEETQRIKDRIDQEFKDRRTLADSGVMGFAAQMAAGVTDPIYLPFMATGVGIWGRGATALGTAGRTALISGVSEVLAESGKHATQRTRTLEESLINVSGATLLSGILGGAGKGISTLRHNRIANKLQQNMDDVLPEITVNSATVLTDDAFDLVNVGGLQHWGVSPLVRVQAGVSEKAKRIVSSMMESPLVTKGNVEGVATTPIGGSVETRIKLHDAPLVESIVQMEDLYTSYRQGMGKTRRIVNDYVLRNRSGKLSYQQFREEIGKALRRNDTSHIPEVQQAAKVFRENVLDPLKDQAIELKMLPEDVTVETAASYLSRVYKVNKIIAERDEWDKIVGDWLRQRRKQALDTPEDVRTDAQKLDAKMTDKKIIQSIDSITDNILGNASGKGSYQLTSTAKPLKARVFTIPDEAIEDFLESDIDMISRQYTRSMSPDVELTRMFGDTSLEKQLNSIKDDFNSKIREATTKKEKTKLEMKKKATLRDVEAMRDRLLGTYKLPNDPDAFFYRAGRVLRDVNFMRMLGGMTLSAIPDMARPIAVNGLKPVGKGLATLALSPRRFNVARKEAKKFAVGLDMVLNSRASSMAEITDIYARGTAFERGLRTTSDTFSKMTLMSQWNSAMKQFSGVVTSDRLITESINRTAGKITKQNLKRMSQAGIGEDMAKRIAKQFEKYGDDGTIKLSNAHLWDDRAAFETFRAAVLKDVDRTIITPGKGEAPLWTSSEVGKLIFQFKSFAGSAHQKILLSDLQFRDAAALNGFLLSVALGSVTYGMKNWVAGRDISTEPEKVIVESLDRSGAFGYFWDLNNVLEKATRGNVGVNPLLGAPPMSRYASRNIVGALLGPSFGTVTDMVDVTGSIAEGEFTKKDLRKVRKMIPGQNLFYMRHLLNELEKEAGKGLKK